MVLGSRLKSTAKERSETKRERLSKRVNGNKIHSFRKLKDDPDIKTYEIFKL